MSLHWYQLRVSTILQSDNGYMVTNWWLIKLRNSIIDTYDLVSQDHTWFMENHKFIQFMRCPDYSFGRSAAILWRWDIIYVSLWLLLTTKVNNGKPSLLIDILNLNYFFHNCSYERPQLLMAVWHFEDITAHVVTWRRTDNAPLHKPVVALYTDSYKCITRPQWIKEYSGKEKVKASKDAKPGHH